MRTASSVKKDYLDVLASAETFKQCLTTEAYRCITKYGMQQDFEDALQQLKSKAYSNQFQNEFLATPVKQMQRTYGNERLCNELASIDTVLNRPIKVLEQEISDLKAVQQAKMKSEKSGRSV